GYALKCPGNLSFAEAGEAARLAFGHDAPRAQVSFFDWRAHFCDYAGFNADVNNPLISFTNCELMLRFLRPKTLVFARTSVEGRGLFFPSERGPPPPSGEMDGRRQQVTDGVICTSASEALP